MPQLVRHPAGRFPGSDSAGRPSVTRSMKLEWTNSLSLCTPPKPTPCTDLDLDGVGDFVGNCTTIANPDQADINRGAVGYACD